MRRLRPLIALTFLLWAVLLAVPMGRTNFVLQATRSGHTQQYFDSDYAFWRSREDPSNFENNTCLDSNALPDSNWILAHYPDDPAVALGLLGGPTSDQIETLDKLIAAHPGDATLIAARLLRSCQNMRVGRYDNPFDDPNWPRPADSDDEPRPSPRQEWLAFLNLANRGAALEPRNTFFDWMRIAALLALHRDSEALTVLNLAADKTDFDDHVKEQTLDTIHAYQLARPLTPMELLRIGHWDFEEEPVLKRTWPCLMGHVIEFRSNGQNDEALKTAYNLLRLGRVLREHAYLLRGSIDGYLAVDQAITDVAVSHSAPAAAPAWLPPLLTSHAKLVLSSTGDLAGYALSLKRAGIARDASSEWAILGQQSKLVTASLFQSPVLPWANLVAIQEQWGRILLHTLPLTILVLLLSLAANRRWTAPGDTPAYVPWAGAMAGGIVLAILAFGDALSVWVTSLNGLQLRLYFYRSSGLYANEQWMVIGGVAGVFVLLSLARTRRWQRRAQVTEPWLTQLKGALFRRNQQWRLNLTPLFQFIALATIWLCLTFGYILLCLYAGSTELRGPEFGSGDGGAGAAIVWTVFFVIAAIRWFRLPDRREALGLVFLNLRRLATGYLLAALLIYPVTALAILPADSKFDQGFQRYVQMGDAAWMREQLGL